MSDHIGTATVKVLPDLSDWERILDSVPAAGLTATEDTTFEYDQDGHVTRQITTRTITKAV